jgi:RNA polymerase sigma factor (sigma-70 family)
VRPDAREHDDERLRPLVERAKNGESDALDEIVRAIQHDVYRLALRMTANPADAEDATQEVLIKVVTRLEGFRGEASVRTWAYRIAVRHILDRKKSRVEEMHLTFDRFADDLLDGLSAEPDPDPLLADEVKRGCTLAMLTCLDREHRLAFVLTDVFDLSHDEAAALCEVSGAVYRQRLSRARRALEAFTRSYCGVLRADAPCSCGRRVAKAESLGRLHRDNPLLMQLPAETLDEATTEMESLHDAARLMRQHPGYLAPAGLLSRVRQTIIGRP